MTDTTYPIPKTASPAEVLRLGAESLQDGLDVCIATVVACAGSAPCMPGQKLLLRSDGSAVGTVGGGGVERAVILRMREMLGASTAVPELLKYHLAKDLGMSCGGSTEIMVEPMYSSTPVLIVGAGHVGLAVARLVSTLQFSVTLVDERTSTLDPERLEGIAGLRALCGKPGEVAHGVPLRGAVVVATHEHALDEEALVWAVREGYRYVGGVGSKAKAAKIKRAMSSLGLPEDRIGRVRMPIGVSIGARTPAEIAVSIAGELIAWRAGCPLE